MTVIGCLPTHGVVANTLDSFRNGRESRPRLRPTARLRNKVATKVTSQSHSQKRRFHAKKERNMAESGRDHLFDVASSKHSTSPAHTDTAILRIVVCVGVALSQPPLAMAQDAVSTPPPEPTILPELSKRTGPEPMKAKGTPIPDAEKPSIEILAGILNEKPAPIVKQTPPPETLALPAAAVEKKAAPVK